MQAISIRDELKDAQKQSTSFLYLIEGFMGLGLIVGVAAVGVIAFRSVVERRQQIGVLRALGFQRGMVSLSFLIETAFIVGIGVVSGTVARAGARAQPVRERRRGERVGVPGAVADHLDHPRRDAGGGAADGLATVPPGSADRPGGGAAIRVSRAS